MGRRYRVVLRDVAGLGCMVEVQGSGFRVQGADFWVEGMGVGFRVQDSGRV